MFHLNTPYGDWPWIVSMPAFSPVPKRPTTTRRTTASSRWPRPVPGEDVHAGLEARAGAQPGLGQGDRPGPRRLPDSIVFDMGMQPDVVNQRLIADAGDDKFAAATGVRCRPR